SGALASDPRRSSVKTRRRCGTVAIEKEGNDQAKDQLQNAATDARENRQKPPACNRHVRPDHRGNIGLARRHMCPVILQRAADEGKLGEPVGYWPDPSVRNPTALRAKETGA